MQRTQKAAPLILPLGTKGEDIVKIQIKISTLFLALIIALFVTNPAWADAFCDGFEQGYKTGYMQAKGSSFEPLTPLCPLQPLKSFGDPESDFEHGYTIGFRKGMIEGSR